jgi:uncharacterized membrane protein
MSKTMQRIGWGVMALFSVGIAVVASAPYALTPLDAIISQSSIFAGRFEGALGPFWLYLHIAGSALALLIGPFQFIRGLCDKRPAVHRWLGRVYLGGVLVGGLGGLIIAQGTAAGMTGRFGFSLLALLWWYTGWQAYTNIRAGRTEAHREWMIRDFALTFAAVTLRLYIGIGLGALAGGIGTVYADFDALFMDVYRTVPWLCWVPNLLVAEAIITRRRARRMAARRLSRMPAGADK